MFGNIIFTKELSSHINSVFWDVFLTELFIICWSCCLYSPIINMSYEIVRSIWGSKRERESKDFVPVIIPGKDPACSFLKGTMDSARETPWTLIMTFSGWPSLVPEGSRELSQDSRNIQSGPSPPPTDFPRPLIYSYTHPNTYNYTYNYTYTSIYSYTYTYT